MRSPFKYFNSSPEVIRLTVLMYVRFPLSLRQVEDLLHERSPQRHRVRMHHEGAKNTTEADTGFYPPVTLI